MTMRRSPVLGTAPYGGPGGCFLASSPGGTARRGSTAADTEGPQTFCSCLRQAKVLLVILATELLRLSLFIYFQDCSSGERRSPRKGDLCLSQLLPFTASTMAPRTMMSVCSASV